MSNSDTPQSTTKLAKTSRSTQAARQAASRAAFGRDVEEFLSDARAVRGVSATTARCYEIDLKQYVAWLCEHSVPSARRVETADIEAFAHHLNDWRSARRAVIARRNTYQEVAAPVASSPAPRRYAPRSIARKLMVVRAWHRFLERTRGYSDPSQGLPSFPAGNIEAPRGLSAHHVAALLEECAGDSSLERRDCALLHLLCSGLTGGEICALRLRDLVPAVPAVPASDGTGTFLRCHNLRRAVTVANRARRKTERRLPITRFVSLDASSVAALENYLPLRAALLEGVMVATSTSEGAIPARPPKPRRTTLLFVASGGRALTPQDVRAIVRDAAQRAGLPPGITPRALRHAFVARSLEDGCDLRVMQARLGHAHLATAQTYYHAAPRRLQDAYRRAHPRA